MSMITMGLGSSAISDCKLYDSTSVIESESIAVTLDVEEITVTLEIEEINYTIDC